MKKILYGISGIGTGHSYRQLPLIRHFAKNCKVVIFAYDESYRIYSEHFKNNKNVKLLRIAVPFIAGNPNGLDWATTARVNKGKDFITINCAALEKAKKLLGKPDLVITDYEPISAIYAYSSGAPLITIDQQSKFLVGKLPKTLLGQSYAEEVMRLRMFFPKADARIACSFFNVEKERNEVTIVPSTLNESITKIKRKPDGSILIYISSQRAFVQSLNSVMEICSKHKKRQFHIFTHDKIKDKAIPNISFYKHGDPNFLNILEKCSGIVSTAGHMLLSEAMYLGIPVYAIPLALYEQQLNAEIINKYKFGVSCSRFDENKLSYFISNLKKFEENIKKDNKILLRRAGQTEIIRYIEKVFLK